MPHFLEELYVVQQFRTTSASLIATLKHFLDHSVIQRWSTPRIDPQISWLKNCVPSQPLGDVVVFSAGDLTVSFVRSRAIFRSFNLRLIISESSVSRRCSFFFPEDTGPQSTHRFESSKRVFCLLSFYFPVALQEQGCGGLWYTTDVVMVFTSLCSLPPYSRDSLNTHIFFNVLRAL